MKSAFERYRRAALEAGADFAVLTSPRTVVTAHWVRLKCQYGCGGWGKRYCCPPYTPTPERTAQMLKEYRHALLYAFNAASASEDARVTRIHKRLISRLERAAFLDGYYKAFGVGCGPCYFCRKCDTSQPCRHPDLARPAMEACGIDVYATARNNGLDVHVVRSYRDICTYSSLLLIE